MPMTGTEEANICWKGMGMKFPEASNQAEKGLERVMVVGVEVGVGWKVMVRL